MFIFYKSLCFWQSFLFVKKRKEESEETRREGCFFYFATLCFFYAVWRYMLERGFYICWKIGKKTKDGLDIRWSYEVVDHNPEVIHIQYHSNRWTNIGVMISPLHIWPLVIMWLKFKAHLSPFHSVKKLWVLSPRTLCIVSLIANYCTVWKFCFLYQYIVMDTFQDRLN